MGECKYLVEGTLMGEDFLIFWLMGGGISQSSLNGKLSCPKFSKPIRILNSFTQNVPRKALSFEFIFCLQVQQTYRTKFGYWFTDCFWSSLCFFVVFLCSLNSLCFFNPIPAKEGGRKITPRPNSLKYLKNNLSY